MAHGHGLFSTPEQVRNFEGEQRTQGLSGLDSALFNAGFAGVSALRRGVFNQDTRSKQERTAGNIQQMIQGLDLTNRKSVGNVANKLQQAGHFNEAAQLIKMMPAGTFGPITEQSLTLPSGRKSVQKVQQGPDGQVRAVGAALKSAAPSKDGTVKLDMGRWNQFGIADNLIPFVNKNFVDQINVGEWFDGPPDEEDLKPIVGKLQILAARLKRDQFESWKQQSREFFGGDTNLANTWLNEQAIDDSIFTQQAINLVKEGGGLENFVTFNSVIDDVIDVKTGDDTTPSELIARRAKIQRNQGFSEENEAINKVISRSRGSVLDGELNLKNVTTDQAFTAFGNFETDSFDEIASNFIREGVPVGDPNSNSFQTHMQHWSWMKNNPVFTRAWMNANNDRERRNLFNDVTSHLVDTDQMQKFWTVTRINSYLKRIKSGKDTRTGIATRFPRK